MKPTGRADKPEQNPSSAIEGHLQSVGLDLETTIFSTSGRGRTFFLTSLFIELIDFLSQLKFPCQVASKTDSRSDRSHRFTPRTRPWPLGPSSVWVSSWTLRT